MILKTLLNNPLDVGKKPWKPWYGVLFGIVILASAGLYVYQRVQGGPVVPTSTVPAVLYENAKLAKEHQGTPGEEEDDRVVQETEVEATDDAVRAVAEVALEKMRTEAVDVAVTEKNLAVPFASQAPLFNWDVVHEDTCEEATILMVAEYFQGTQENIDPTVADAALLNMVAEETAQGLFTSLTAEELGRFAEGYFPNLVATVIEDPTIEEIQSYILAGVPVIVPAAGQQLGNPFYTGAGPLYHYFLIRGFDEETFITNDPGTRHGENYSYKKSVIMDAMGDWNDGNPTTGAKRILILSPKGE